MATRPKPTNLSQGMEFGEEGFYALQETVDRIVQLFPTEDWYAPLQNSATVAGSWTFTGSPTFSGSATFSGNVTFTGTTTFDGPAVFNDPVTITDDVTISLTKHIYFGDTGVHAASLADGHLDLTADTSVDIHSTLMQCDSGTEIAFGTGSNRGYVLGNSSTGTLTLYGGSQITLATSGDGGQIYTATRIGMNTTLNESAKIAIVGTDGSATTGSIIRMRSTVNTFPSLVHSALTHDNVAWAADAYQSTATVWKSSDPDSNFAMWKYTDTWFFNANTGTVAGNTVTWTTGMQMSNAGEITYSPSADRKLYIRDAAIYLASLADGYLDVAADTAIRLSAPITEIATSTKLQFRDSAIYINSGADGFLDLTADTGIRLNHTAVATVTVPYTDALQFGSLEIGSWSPVATYAYFGNSALNHGAITNYALLQQNTGETYLNAPTGKAIYFRIANNDEWTLQSTGHLLADTSNQLQFRDTAIYINSGADGYLDLVADTAIRIGDGGSTNYVEVENDGDVNFVAGAGLQYGEIYGYDVGSTITISGTGIANKVQITSFATNGASNGSVTPDHTNDHITIGKAGFYKVHVAISAESGAGASFVGAFNVYKNNGGTQFQNCRIDRSFAGGGGDVGSICITGLIDCAVNDTIELWCWNETNTTDIVIDDVSMHVIQIGGT